MNHIMKKEGEWGRMGEGVKIRANLCNPWRKNEGEENESRRDSVNDNIIVTNLLQKPGRGSIKFVIFDFLI